MLKPCRSFLTTERRSLEELGLTQEDLFLISWVKTLNGQAPENTLSIFTHLGSQEDCRNGTSKYISSQIAEDDMWRRTEDAVTQYVRVIRSDEDTNPDKILYFVINFGTYLRFYKLMPACNDLIAWPESRAYEMADDEEAVWDIWNQLVDKMKGH